MALFFFFQNSNVGWVDLGGSYLGRGQNRALRMVKQLELELYPVNEKESLVQYDAYVMHFLANRRIFHQFLFITDRQTKSFQSRSVSQHELAGFARYQ